MKTREELMLTKEFWFETLQNDIYRVVSDYIANEGINQTQLADKLGVSKGYISQILNGNFNATLKKLIELSLAVGVAPAINFNKLDEYINEDKKKRFEMHYSHFSPFTVQSATLPINSGVAKTTVTVKPSNKSFEFKAA